VTAIIDPETDAPGEGGPRGFWTWPRAIAVLVVLGFAAFWAYLFAVGGSYKPAGYLTDRTFPVAAEKICKASMAQLDALPPAHTAKNADVRAHTIDQADAILRDMQRQLRGIVPATKDAHFIGQWVDDWSIFISDRDTYAANLRKDPHAEYLVTQKYGAQISESLDNYADVNKMPSCETPGDV
jgi:hypothetical protein